MPFHPTCFDIFHRISRLHFGRVDVDGLMGWRDHSSSYKGYYGFPRDPAVTRGQQQCWRHNAGDEWLVANPLFIPGLDLLLEAAISKSPFFDPQNNAFSIVVDNREMSRSNTRASAQPTDSPQDPFQTIPQEVMLTDILLIMDQLTVLSLET